MGIKIWWPVLFVGTIILACVLIFPSDLRLADLFDKAGRVDDAIEHYQKVLAEEPDRFDLRIQLGQLYVLKREFKKALVEFEAAGKQTDLGPVQLDQLYQIYSSLEDKEKTVAVLERLVDISPNDQHYQVKLADAYEWNRDPGKAIRLYDQLLKQDPDNLRYLNKLVTLNLTQKNYASCISRLNHMVRLEPENQDTRLLLGNIYLETSQRNLAAREFERCLRLTPDNEALRVRLAELYLWMENYENGIQHYEYLVRRHVLKDAYFDKLITHTRDFYPDKAIEYFNFRLKYLPRKKELREQLLDLSQYLGLTDDAIEQLNLLIQSYPEEISYQLELAELYKKTQQPLLAANTLESIYKDGNLDSEILDELIPHYQTEQEYQELQELYAAAISHGLADLELRNEFAELLVRLRKHDEAIAQYLALLELAPRDTDSRAALAELYVLTENNRGAYDTFWQGVDRLGIQDQTYLVEAAQFFVERQHYSEAVATYEKLMRQNPYNRYYNTLAADLYIQTKDFKKAGLTYRRMLDSEPDDVALKFQLASVYWLQNDRTKTELIINDIETSHTHHPNIDKEIGKFYFEHGFLSNAVEHLEFALEAAPTDSATMRMLGLAYAWSNQPNAAKKLLNRYHRRYSFDYYSHFQLGEIYRGEGNKAKATAEFEMATRLVQSAPQTRESLMVKGKLYAYRNQPEESLRQFEILINTYPADQGIYTDFAEGLLTLKEYEESEHWIEQALMADPNNYRARRLLSRSYFEQKKYSNAAKILAELQSEYGGDIGLRVDLADAQLAAGDWYTSEKTLAKILRQYPDTLPAEQRLLILRREQSQAFATDYQVEEQSGSYLKQVYNFVASKAASSLAHIKLLLGEEVYSSGDTTKTEYQNLSLKLSSRLGPKLQSSVTTTAQRHVDHWNVSATGMVRWYLTPSNSVSASASFNELWRDPIVSALHEGRMNSLQANLNVHFLRKAYLRNEITYQRHRTPTIDHFGNAFRASVLLGYNWLDKPLLSTYYQFYKLNYNYQDPANSLLISIPQRQDTHYFGATLGQQLSRRFFYQLSGSLGRSNDEQSMIYFGSLDLEYVLFKQLRLRSHLLYGNVNRLVGNENIKALKLDLFYFY